MELLTGLDLIMSYLSRMFESTAICLHRPRIRCLLSCAKQPRAVLLLRSEPTRHQRLVDRLYLQSLTPVQVIVGNPE